MAAEWLTSAILIAVLTTGFGHFETVRPWTFLWIFALPTLGAVFHVIWCRRHGINPLTAETRDRYEQLRRR
ncbi:hypothetical protein [Actinoplanes awajinensis]|uniref:Uncharacterized protein n=1 Tax=Actinoplanes awajinensis subsp. mycoplanecinus TaxID=135947 RepID=A0A101JBB1_9ACTN|nr:hypothetical protein [Actinoplanes awajinensis]KUL23633.1 hypothetical protein ADL15_45405 [Actinoplanes awajinensis subsp. mycoplanecinus]